MTWINTRINNMPEMTQDEKEWKTKRERGGESKRLTSQRKWTGERTREKETKVRDTKRQRERKDKEHEERKRQRQKSKVIQRQRQILRKTQKDRRERWRVPWRKRTPGRQCNVMETDKRTPGRDDKRQKITKKIIYRKEQH